MELKICTGGVLPESIHKNNGLLKLLDNAFWRYIELLHETVCKNFKVVALTDEEFETWINDESIDFKESLIADSEFCVAQIVVAIKKLSLPIKEREHGKIPSSTEDKVYITEIVSTLTNDQARDIYKEIKRQIKNEYPILVEKTNLTIEDKNGTHTETWTGCKKPFFEEQEEDGMDLTPKQIIRKLLEQFYQKVDEETIKNSMNFRVVVGDWFEDGEGETLEELYNRLCK